jgi:arylsulfatase A-like enzyme
MNHGYRVEGAGKLFHHHLAGAYHDADSFHNFLSMPWPPDAPMPPAKLNGLFEYGSANTDWGPWPGRDENAVDVRTVDWCIDRLRQPSTEPLFLACGLFRPHMPFFVPAAWLERYPPDQVVMPETDEHDLEDIPAGGRELMSQAARFFSGMLDGENRIPGSYREAVRCYQASATFADAQIGRLLDALDNSPQMRSTVIVLWSDHGYQLGEKQCWEKFTLWEKATRVPFIIVAPGIAQPGAICERPVSLLDIYPTLVDLCGLPLLEQLEGATLKRWLQIPHAERDRPAIMTYLRGNHAIRSNHWRYIRYADGTEELYDHRNDSQERDNLANDPHYATVLAEHRRWLPTEDAPPAPDKKESG